MQSRLFKKIPACALLPVLLAGMLLITCAIAGCTTPSSPSGAASAKTSVVSIGAIVKDPSSFEGRELVLNGKIAAECGSGCWFLLDDGTGTLYVDLKKNNFVIPQMSGSSVAVKGVIHVENGDPKLFAASVTDGSRSWP